MATVKQRNLLGSDTTCSTGFATSRRGEMVSGLGTFDTRNTSFSSVKSISLVTLYTCTALYTAFFKIWNWSNICHVGACEEMLWPWILSSKMLIALKCYFVTNGEAAGAIAKATFSGRNLWKMHHSTWKDVASCCTHVVPVLYFFVIWSHLPTFPTCSQNGSNSINLFNRSIDYNIL